jgi:3-dehydroquinate dehydratase II
MGAAIHVLNGPNLNLLGEREPEIYGHETLADVEAKCRTAAGALGLDIVFRQSNIEGELVDWIQAARRDAAGIIINPAAYTHTSIALLDALTACACPIVEVHISNVHRRESFRARSYVSRAATAVIAGCGTEGYIHALRHLALLVGTAA